MKDAHGAFMFKTTNTSFASESVTYVTVRVQYC